MSIKALNKAVEAAEEVVYKTKKELFDAIRPVAEAAGMHIGARIEGVSFYDTSVSVTYRINPQTNPDTDWIDLPKGIVFSDTPVESMLEEMARRKEKRQREQRERDERELLRLQEKLSG